MKIDLTIDQYILVVRNELAKRLSGRCGVRIIGDEQQSIRISWDNWHFESSSGLLKVYYDGEYPIDECVRLIIEDLQIEFVKILFKQNSQ